MTLFIKVSRRLLKLEDEEHEEDEDDEEEEETCIKSVKIVLS